MGLIPSARGPDHNRVMSGVVGQKTTRPRGDQFKQIKPDHETKFSALFEKGMIQIPVNQRIKSTGGKNVFLTLI